jgi:protein-L-isoaspartate O-methyltransferase
VHRIISFKHVDPSALEAWKERLAIGGRIVLPRRESVYVFEKTGNGEFMEKSFFGFHFPQN